MLEVEANRGYRTIPLGDFCNAGTDVLAPFPQSPATRSGIRTGAPPSLGRVMLRGFPFAIGTDPARCFLALSEGATVSVPLQATARTVLFAWRLLDSQIMEGGPVGIHVAGLKFDYSDGFVEKVAIRDRFEVATLPVNWGQLPFRAVPDNYDSLPLRYQGRFELGGWRQTEVEQAWPRHWWLWAWRNPNPDRPIDSLEIMAREARLVIGGITLGQVDELPLRLPASSTVRIDLDDPEAAARIPIELEIGVDRGTSTFVYPLSTQTEEDLRQDPLRGFGEEVNHGSSPVYAKVSALPSATLTVRDGSRDLGSVAWKDIESGGGVSSGLYRIRLADPGRNWVRTEVVDADTGRPLPCRVHFRSPDGVPYPPHGHSAHVGSDMGTWHIDVGGDVKLGRLTYAYIDGSCEGWLPRGEVIVDVARGFEYEPLRTRLSVEPGQQSLRLQLKRMRDMNAEGWFSGDTHVHFLSTQGAQTEARGEDLNVVNLLLSQWGHLFTNTEEFSGQPSISRDGNTVVFATQENRQHFLGHLTLLGLKQPVMPWCSDGPGEAEMGGSLEITLSEWADRCHAQGGTVILPHMPNPNGEPAAMIATGRVDGVEFLWADRYNHAEYYRYLNGGYRLPLVGGTDKMTAEVPVGLYRTYVRIPEDEPFTYESWCRSLARGRTFLSSGPLVFLRVDGAQPGDLVRVRGGGSVEVEAEMESIFPIQSLQLVLNGEVVAATENAQGARRLRLHERIKLERDGWLAARAGGTHYYDFIAHRDVSQRGLMAHTSPVYLATGHEYSVHSESTVQYMLTLVEGALLYINELSTQQPADRVTHHHGGPDHIARLSRPFLEARQMLERSRRSR